MITQITTERKSVKISKRNLLNLFEDLPGRVELLNANDRALVNLFLSSQKFRDIAANAKVHEATIARRLKKIAARIESNNFVNAISQNLKPLELQILKDYFVNGLPMIKIARKNNIPYCSVRKLVKARQ